MYDKPQDVKLHMYKAQIIVRCAVVCTMHTSVSTKVGQRSISELNISHFFSVFYVCLLFLLGFIFLFYLFFPENIFWSDVTLLILHA